MKRKLLLAAFVAVGAVGMRATDYVTNGDNLIYTKRVAGNPTTADVKESWCDNASQAFDLSQELTTLPAGVYTLSLQAMYRASTTSGTATNCVVYAATDGNYYDAALANFGDYSATESLSGVTTAMETPTNYLNTLPYFVVAEDNATVRVGARSIGNLTRCTNGYWFIWKTSSFNVSDVSDSEVLASALADVKAEAKAILDAADDSDEKDELQAIYDAATATGSSIAALKKAIKTYAGLMGSATTPLDVTSIYVNNGDFSQGIALDNSNTKNGDAGRLNLAPMGWTNSDTGNGEYNYFSIVANNTEGYDSQSGFAYNGKTTGNSLYMRHAWGAATITASQTITLPEGRYKVSIPAKKTGKTATVKYTFAGKEDSRAVTTDWVAYEKTFDATSTNNTLTIELKYVHDEGGGQRAFFDGVTLTAYGDPLKASKVALATVQSEAVSLLANATYDNIVGVERTSLTTQSTAAAESETVDAYQTAVDNIQAAIDAFTAAKTNYDALVAEIAKAKALGIANATADGYAATSSSTATTALTNTKNLKVAEFEYVRDTYSYGVELGTWTTTGPTGSKNDQHWSGTTRTYLEQSSAAWSQSSWTINYNQDLTLPAGNYVFKVSGRQADSDGVTLSLTVKNGETTLGTVSDFPKGDTGLGITVNGATWYSTENDSTFANNNNGRGWEWRYVKFALDSDATVNVAVDAVATTNHMWVSFCDATVQTDDEANVSLIAYNIALNDATTARDNATYTNVKGTEKANLLAAIAADTSLDKTEADDIDAATTVLTEATEAFTGAKTNYDNLTTAITNATTLTTAAVNVGSGVFQIPTSAKTTLEDATSTAQSALDAADATSSSAASAATTLNTAISTYNNSANAPDENQAYVIANNSIDGGALKITTESVTVNTNAVVFFTAVEGGYVLSNASGEYIFKTTGNTWTLSTTENKAEAYVVTIGYEEGGYTITGANGKFGTDATDLGSEVYANKTASKNGIWTISEAESTTITSSANLQGYKTFYNADVNYEVDANTTIYKAAAPAEGYVTLTEVSTDKIIPAGTPVILKTSNTTDYKITLTPTATASSNDFDGNVLQVAASAGSIEGAYILAYKNPDFGFWQYTGSLDAGDIYLTASEGGAKSRLIIVVDGEATAINAIEADEVDDTPLYNLAGQRVNKDYKGIVIKKNAKYIMK